MNNALLEHVLSVIKKYREQNGLTVILRSEAALDYDKSLDVTGAAACRSEQAEH